MLLIKVYMKLAAFKDIWLLFYFGHNEYNVYPIYIYYTYEYKIVLFPFRFMFCMLLRLWIMFSMLLVDAFGHLQELTFKAQLAFTSSELTVFIYLFIYIAE